MESKQLLFEELEYHIVNDVKPSKYLDDNFRNNSLSKQYPFDMLTNLISTPQSPLYHPEGSVWNHTLMVVDKASEYKNKSSNVKVFMWAALLHDIGKYKATKIRKGKITSYEHDLYGEPMSEEFLKQFTEDLDFIRQVKALVRWHMQTLFIAKNLPFSNIKAMLEQTSMDEVALLSLCDRLGRGNLSYDKAEDEKKSIKLFLKKCKEALKE